MKNLIIRAVGRLPEPWQKEAIHMYQKRLSAFGGIEIVELKEGSAGSAKPDTIRVMDDEADELLKGLPDQATIIALDETGMSISSQDFSQKLKEWWGKGPIVFLIGGSWGLDKKIIQKSDFVLSLGKMTLPHGLARVVLIEQLYRAKMIESGREYHK